MENRTFIPVALAGAILLSGCSLSTNIKDLDGATSPPSQIEKDMKMSPGAVQSKSGSIGMRANITTTDQVLSGSSLRAKVSIGQIHR